MNCNKSHLQLATCLAVVLVAITGGHLVRCQFLQPQSHLGRLVQSITSPLVLASSLSDGADSPASESSSYDSESGPVGGPIDESGPYQSASGAAQQRPHYYQQDGGRHYQHYQRQPARQTRVQQQTSLQQAPSQQRGVPQQYYGPGSYSHDDEDSGAPTNRKQHASSGAEQYQMGAYLGPTIDDKEIQGAFNSNDERDDDEAAGYEGPPANGGRHRATSSYASSQPSGVSGPTGGYGTPADHGRHESSGVDGGRSSSSRGRGDRTASFDDDSNIDEEDDRLAEPRQPRFRSSASLNQAASQYHQRQNNQYSPQQQRRQSSMMAAANGFSPMGAAGPFDLSGLVGAPGLGGYEVYNGDGSYPGYYPQQNGGGRNGRRNQAASMNNPYAGPYGQTGPYVQSAANQQRGGGDNDDVDSDADED